MNSNLTKSYNFQNIYTESNENLRSQKILNKKYTLNNIKNSPTKNIYNNRNSYNIYKTPYKKMNNSYINLKSNISKNNNSFSFITSTQENLLWKKKNKKYNNKSPNFFDSSIKTNSRNKSIYETNNLNKTKPLFYESKKLINPKNSNPEKDFKMNILLNNKQNNNKLKRKFDHLLDLALKKDNKIKKHFEIKKLSNMEMTIERIRNQNRIKLFKKKVELNIPNRRRLTNKVESIKKNLSQKLFSKLNYSQIYNSNNFNSNINLLNFPNKRNQSFKDSFLYLNDDIFFKNERLNDNNCYNRILNTQNIYRPNRKLDYYRRMIENENFEQNGIYNRNNTNLKYKLKYLTTELKFFDSKNKIYINK